MTQEEKLEKVTMWLATNHIRHRIHIKGVDEKLAPYMRIVTREKRVVLCVCPPDEEGVVFNEARKLGMHPVLGSSKQVSWASDIRAEKLADAEKLATKVNKNKDMFDGAVNKMKNETSASWWIDRRDDTIMDILKELIIK